MSIEQVAIAVSVLMGIGSIVASSIVGLVGYLMKRSVESADRKLDELPKIREAVGYLKTDVALIKKDIDHHSEKQDEFCERLERFEKSWRPHSA